MTHFGLIWFQNYLKTFSQSLSFCTSSRAAFQLVMRNLLRVVVLDSVTDFLLLLGKLVVVLLCGSTSYLAFHGHIPEVGLRKNYRSFVHNRIGDNSHWYK